MPQADVIDVIVLRGAAAIGSGRVGRGEAVNEAGVGVAIGVGGVATKDGVGAGGGAF